MFFCVFESKKIVLSFSGCSWAEATLDPARRRGELGVSGTSLGVFGTSGTRAAAIGVRERLGGKMDQNHCVFPDQSDIPERLA